MKQEKKNYLPSTLPSTNAMTAHPSASHFALGGYLPDLVTSTSSGTTVQTATTGGKTFHSLAESKAPGTVEKSVCGNGQAAQNTYNRLRGFTQQMYDDANDVAERQRRAQELQKAHLDQIEERRRLRDEEKARKLEEDRKEEMRIREEQARLQQLADVEKAERTSKMHQEESAIQQLHENLRIARDKACMDRRGVGLVPNQTQQLQSASVPDLKPPPPDQSHQSRNSKSLCISSAMQTCCLEDAVVQTDPVVCRATGSPNGQSEQATRSGRRLMAVSRTGAVAAAKAGQKNRPPAHLSSNGQLAGRGNDPRRNSRDCPDHARALRANAATTNKNSSTLDATVGFQRHRSNTGERCPKVSTLCCPSRSHTDQPLSERSDAMGLNKSSNPTRIPVPISVGGGHFSTLRAAQNRRDSAHRLDYSEKAGSLWASSFGAANVIRTDNVLAPPVSHPQPDTTLQNPKFSYKPSSENTVPCQDSLLHHLSKIRKSLQLRQMVCESESD